MPFQEILREIISSEGVEGAVFLDSEGEAILSCGSQETEQLQLLGAYQAIILSLIGRLVSTSSKTIFTLCENRVILTHHLKDGYFICIVFSPELNFAWVQFRF